MIQTTPTNIEIYAIVCDKRVIKTKRYISFIMRKRKYVHRNKFWSVLTFSITRRSNNAFGRPRRVRAKTWENRQCCRR